MRWCKKKRVATGGVAGAALLIALPFIILREGESLEAYKDVVGVWTICHGETHGVTEGMVKTKAECDAMSKSRIGEFMSNVQALIKVPVTAHVLAAHTSFAYNIGVGGYSRSTTLKRTNAGDIKGGCEAMLLWFKAGGKDCRPRRSGCWGVYKRRQDEVALCLSGL
ncbi:lysozyme [uncultured Paraglaciecola sp.]|uniref:lysozyme n=1 Tax=uncultured Paraglaciecola sp. TaxID=1765024 RepID=UPI00262F94D8|nr:lysozyme [uncultured Paraglaciecola sp.]